MNTEDRVKKLERRFGGPGKAVYIAFQFYHSDPEEVREAKRVEAVKEFEEEHATEVNLDRVTFIEIEIFPGRNPEA